MQPCPTLPNFLPFMDHSFVMIKELVQLSEALMHAVQSHSRWTDHSGEF